MSLTISYLWSEYRKRIYLTLRQLAFLSIVVATVFFFSAMWPAINYNFTATFQNAHYDIRVNGPLTKPEIDTIIKTLEPYKPTYVGLNAGSVNKIFVNGKTFNNNIVNYYYNPSTYKGISLTYFSNGMLLQGSMDSQDAWGIDYMTAKQLGIKIGDHIGFEQGIGDRYGNVRKVRHYGTVKALYATSNEVNGLLTPLSQDTSKLLSADGVVYTDIFIRLENIEPLKATALLHSIPNSDGWLIEAVPEAYARGRARVEQTLNRNVRYATIWAALLIYAIFILREQFNRMERRKKNLAILFSLGLSERGLLKLFISEQIALNFSTGLLGLWLGMYVLQSNLGLYVPEETSRFFIGMIFVIILLALGLSLAQLLYRLRRIDVARLLATE